MHAAFNRYIFSSSRCAPVTEPSNTDAPYSGAVARAAWRLLFICAMALRTEQVCRTGTKRTNLSRRFGTRISLVPVFCTHGQIAGRHYLLKLLIAPAACTTERRSGDAASSGHGIRSGVAGLVTRSLKARRIARYSVGNFICSSDSCLEKSALTQCFRSSRAARTWVSCLPTTDWLGWRPPLTHRGLGAAILGSSVQLPAFIAARVYSLIFATNIPGYAFAGVAAYRLPFFVMSAIPALGETAAPWRNLILPDGFVAVLRGPELVSLLSLTHCGQGPAASHWS